MIFEVQFEVFGPCNKSCSYCMAKQSSYLGKFGEDIFDKFESALQRVKATLAASFIQPRSYALVGGEPSFWPLEVQNRFIALMEEYQKSWTVFTNGYDLKAPILNHPDWHYLLHLFPETLKDTTLEELPPWPMVIVDGSMDTTNLHDPRLRVSIDSNLYRDHDLATSKQKLIKFGLSHEQVLETRKDCYCQYKILRIDVVHGVVYPCCKSAERVPLEEFQFWKKPLCQDCIPFSIDWKPL